MIEIKVGKGLKKTKLLMYESIDELPINLYNRVNEYALLDYEIGHNISHVNNHFKKLDQFLTSKKIDEAIQERTNLHQNLWNMINKINFPSLQFACFIHSVNGKQVTDYSQEGLTRLLDKLSKKGLTQGMVKGTTEDLKKKSTQN